MRIVPLLVGLCIAALPVPTGSANHLSISHKNPDRPVRVMSLNQCTDQLVLALLEPERITSVTWLSRDPDASLMHREAMNVAINHGLAEEVVRQKPDLVVAGKYTTPATRGLLKRLGFPLLELDHADSFEDIRRITRQLAKAVDESARGEALIAAMDKSLAELAQHPVTPVQVAAWDGAGFSARKGSLYDEVLIKAGAVNVANQPPASLYGRPDTEVLLLAAPDLLIKGSAGQAPGLRDNVTNHPVVRRIWAESRALSVRPAAYMCGTPMVADAVVTLHHQLKRSAKLGPPPVFSSRNSSGHTAHNSTAHPPAQKDSAVQDGGNTP